MAKSYFPSANMTRGLFLDNGFTEPAPAEELRIGGYVFVREHKDGRMQTAYVVPWSNYAVAEKDGTAPCRLCIRLNPDASRDISEAISTAKDATHTWIPFDKGQWREVTATFVQAYLPVFDAPTADAMAKLAALGEVPLITS